PGAEQEKQSGQGHGPGRGRSRGGKGADGPAQGGQRGVRDQGRGQAGWFGGRKPGASGDRAHEGRFLPGDRPAVPNCFGYDGYTRRNGGRRMKTVLDVRDIGKRYPGFTLDRKSVV